MPKEIVNITLQRSAKNEKWGFVMIGGKDQALTVKVGKVRSTEKNGKLEMTNRRSGKKIKLFLWECGIAPCARFRIFFSFR